MIDMNTAANVAEIGGGVAILVSLMYVGFQVRQSNKIAKAESARAIQSMAFMDQFDMENIGRGFIEFDSLDYSDKWEFHQYFLNLWSHWIMVLESRELGLVTQRFMDSWTGVIAEIVVTPGMQQYFAQGARDRLMPHALKVIEDYIESNSATITPYNQQMKWFTETG
jgi:hypothetical protein